MENYSQTFVQWMIKMLSEGNPEETVHEDYTCYADILLILQMNTFSIIHPLTGNIHSNLVSQECASQLLD
jgi:hypothetical protein